MKIDAILERLARSPLDEDAWKALRPALTQMALSKKDQPDGVVGAVLDEAVDAVEFKLIQLIQLHQTPWTQSASGYVFTMLRNASIDLYRKRKNTDRVDPLDDHTLGTVAPDHPTLDNEDDWRLLTLAYERAHSTRQERHRDKLRQSWERAQLKVAQELSFPQLVQQVEHLDRGAPDFKKTLDRYTKAQTHLREALLNAITAMEADHTLSALDASLARQAMNTWLRCPRRAARRVSPGKEAT